MEEETETLDWGQEEEEHQAILRKASFDQENHRDFGDVDDIEDTVSLGEDEDEPIYYNQPQDAPRSAYHAVPALEVPERPPSSQRRSDDSGANGHREVRYRNISREPERLETSSSRDSYKPAESPPRQRRSANQSSPQRHQQNGTRITHALPPKPALAQVPYLPPSHPSMVEAIGMASTSISPPSRPTIRDPKKLNGTHTRSRSPMQAELPPGWEKRHSRNGGHVYYYHPETEETTWDFPVSKLPSASTHGGSPRRRRLSASPGHMNLTSPDSNKHHSQTTPSRQQPSHPQPDNEQKDHTKSVTSDPDGLSYEDRHYRPGGGDPPSTALEIKIPEHLDGSVMRPQERSRYDKSPSPSRHRRRPRSISPQPDSRGPANERDYSPARGNGRSARDRNVNTNPDPVSHREIDAMSSQSEFSNRRWESSSHAPVSDFSRSERGSRRAPHRDEDDFMLEPRSSDNKNRPSLRRRESSRGPKEREPRDREPPPRPTDNRRDKPSESQNFISAPRYRSPPRTHERDLGRDFGPPPPDVAPYSGPPSQTRRDRDRPSRFEQLGSNGPPPPGGGGPSNRGNEPYAGRPRNYDMPPNFDQSRHREARVREMEPERPRRDPLSDGHGIRPPPNSYSGEPNRMPMDRAKRFADDYNQARPEEPPHRRRAPLPPQTKTFSTSIMPGHENDSFPYGPGWAMGDLTIPKEPRYVNDASRPPRGPDPKQDRPLSIRNPPPQRLPPAPPQGISMANDYDRPKPSSYPPPPAYEPKDYPRPSEGYRPRRDQSPLRHGPGNAPRQVASSNAIPRGLDSRPDSRQGPGPGPGYQNAFSDRNAFNNDRRDQDVQHDGRPQWKDNRPGNMYSGRNTLPPKREIPNRPMDAPAPRRPSGGPVSGTNNVPIGTRRAGPQGYAPPPHSGPAPQSEMKPTYNPDARPPVPEIRRRESNGNMGTIRSDEFDDQDSPVLVEERRKEIFKAKEIALVRATQSRLSVNEPQAAPVYPFGSQATPPPISRNLSAMSLTSDHLPPRPSDRDSYDNRSDTRPRGRSGSYNQGATYAVPNAPPLAESSQAGPPIEAPASNELSRSSQQDQHRQHRERPSRWGPEIRRSNEQASELPPTMQTDSPPALARRMSSERPPRLRKYPASSANVAGADNDFRGGNGNSSTNAPPSDSGALPLDDFKDRLEVNRPTLLDRLSTSEGDGQPSLRDRLVPSKRDREDLDEGHPPDSSYDIDDGNDNKRARRRNTKGNRRGGGGGRRVIS